MGLLLPRHVAEQISREQAEAARPPEPEKVAGDPQTYQFFVGWQDEVWMFCRLVEQAGGAILSIKNQGTDRFSRGWDIEYRHTEELDMERKC